ncbi:BA14K family protein [Oryzifoliimicrobium ureilyticus]|uniref:BA14K family protein n=1 Tax=Oryzifoliimicrobium ureilyticus TaxID=3113724 RepID=UPI00307646C6
MKKIAIIALSALTAFTSIPAYAGPGFVNAVGSTASDVPSAASGDVTKVYCNGPCLPKPKYLRENQQNGGWNGDRGWRGHGWRDRGDWRGRGDWHGRRYYRDRDYYRYRHHNNAGAIIGGLAAGAIIGGALSARPSYRPPVNSHTSWCYNRYRSYRASDNTFQPNSGPRRQCVSPY